MANHETDWDRRGIYVEYATFRVLENQWIGTLWPAKSFAVPAEQLEQAINRMAGFNAPPAPRSYQGRRLDRHKRVDEGERRLSCCAVFKLMQLLGWLCCGCQLTSLGSTYDRKPGRRLG